jgi:hypothetical protein
LDNLTPQPSAQQQLDQTSARPKLSNNLVNRGRPVVRRHDKVLSEMTPVSRPTDGQHAVEELHPRQSLPVARRSANPGSRDLQHDGNGQFWCAVLLLTLKVVP